MVGRSDSDSEACRCQKCKYETTEVEPPLDLLWHRMMVLLHPPITKVTVTGARSTPVVDW
jgi:hypothetical protein